MATQLAIFVVVMSMLLEFVHGQDQGTNFFLLPVVFMILKCRIHGTKR